MSRAWYHVKKKGKGWCSVPGQIRKGEEEKKSRCTFSMPAISLSTCRCVILSQNKGGEGCHVASEKKRRRKHSRRTLYTHRLSPLCVATVVLNLNKGGLLQCVRKEKKKIERAYLICPRSVPAACCRPSRVTSLKR